MLDKWNRFFKKEATKASESNAPAAIASQCFITISSTEPGVDFDISSFLNGEHNAFFVDKEKENQPSIYFDVRCKVYDSLETLFAHSGVLARGKTANGMFILVAPYDQNQLRQFVAKGKFNDAIQKAYNYKDAVKNGGSDAIKSNKIDSINNPHFVTIKKLTGSSPSS
jgi:hypothetical protein